MDGTAVAFDAEHAAELRAALCDADDGLLQTLRSACTVHRFSNLDLLAHRVFSLSMRASRWQVA